MIHFKDRHGAQGPDPVGAGVEPRSEDHDLLDALPQRPFHGIVDEAGPGHRGCSRTRPSMVDVAPDDGADQRKLRKADHEAQARG